MSSSDKAAQWRELCRFLETTYYAPDLEAIQIILSTYCSHFFYKEPPVWLFVLGPSGTGKTELGLNPIETLKQVEPVHILTPNSFLSGYQQNGILQRAMKDTQGHIVLSFSDFTTYLTMEFNKRREITGQLRQMYAGECVKDAGNQDRLTWKGKCTIIAACTNAIERYWGEQRDLGERFVNVRWRYGDRKKYLPFALKHINREHKIRTKYYGLVQEFVNADTLKNTIPEQTRQQQYARCYHALSDLTIFVCRSRVHVFRDIYGTKKGISDIGDEEGPPRLFKALCNIAISSTILMRSTVIEDANIKLAQRVAIDTIPLPRRQILTVLARIGGSILLSQLATILKTIPVPVLTRHVEDMALLDLVRVTTHDNPASDDLDTLTDQTIVLNTFEVPETVVKLLQEMRLKHTD